LTILKHIAQSQHQLFFQINPGRSDSLELVITDPIGRIISRQNFHLMKGDNQINTKKLVQGIYQVYGTNAEGKSQRLRFTSNKILQKMYHIHLNLSMEI
jgi:hypothetical protein